MWNRRLADVYFTLSHQTQKPMTPNEFLHFGIPETVEARYARAAARYEEMVKHLG